MTQREYLFFLFFFIVIVIVIFGVGENEKDDCLTMTIKVNCRLLAKMIFSCLTRYVIYKYVICWAPLSLFCTDSHDPNDGAADWSSPESLPEMFRRSYKKLCIYARIFFFSDAGVREMKKKV